ncbi:hypothetical protein JMN32_00240 [Fulvivirga sp. 29W222]|uniref:Uncharacterized protein n=1 Tax=Fulvivirga marina TaxID=2494733 RepID=A0A937FXF8_9BACT|nr:hypothetical protein [Fulvivirga marina]MBL6444716.1 hypothetical protein [Fulvivirga marina]
MVKPPDKVKIKVNDRKRALILYICTVITNNVVDPISQYSHAGGICEAPPHMVIIVPAANKHSEHLGNRINPRRLNTWDNLT